MAGPGPGRRRGGRRSGDDGTGRSHGPGGLRWLAKLIVRGADATYVRVELDDAFERDLERGIRPLRARWRYAVNVVGSGFSLWRARRSRRGNVRRFSDDSIARRRRRGPAYGISWLDVKLGLRMILKQPGLTAVAVFALGIGIPVGFAPTFFVNAMEAPLPAPGGDRIRLLRYWNTATSRMDATTYDDFERWRGSLGAFETLAAVRTAGHNVDAPAGGVTVPGAEVTASAFEMLRARPLHGRTLTAEDESIGGPAVVVIGYEFWRARMAGDPNVVGSTIRLGGVPHTVVGVMRDGFRFPSNQQLWLPLRERPAAGPRQGRPVAILGRLADGVSVRQAQAELAAFGRRMAAEFPDSYERLEAEVVPIAQLVFGLPKGGMRTLPEFWVVHVLTLLLLVVAGTNVGLLVYARAATRSSEMAVRTALGATRARIVTQVFTESLVLAVLAAGAGLLLIDRIAGILPSQIVRFLAGSMADASGSTAVLPYWVDPGVKVSTVVWALGLAVFCAVIAGVVPALRVTGRAVQRNMQQARAGHSGFRFGGVTGALMVMDVALAVAVVGFAAGVSDSLREAWAGHRDLVGIPAEEYLSASLYVQRTEQPAAASAVDREAYLTHVAATQRALVERLKAEPGVRGVAVASVLPRMNHPTRAVELEGEDAAGDFGGHRVKSASVDIGFFDALDQPILSGRGFNSADLREDGPAVVIVNTPFVERVLGGRNPIGRRIRFTGLRGEDPGPWLEIVGIAPRIGMDIMNADGDEGVYRPLAPGEINPIRLAIHVGEDPESFIPRLRAIMSEVDPNAIVRMAIALDRVYEGDWYIMAAVGLGGVLFVGILLALAASGIYAMMSFAVVQRTREIGIRSALGAQRNTIVLTVARRALLQLTSGVLLGLPVGVKLFLAVGETGFTLSTAALSFVPGLGILVLVGLTACTAPTLRALRIDAATALREGI